MVSLIADLCLTVLIQVGGEKLARKFGWWDENKKFGEARFDSKTGKLIKDD